MGIYVRGELVFLPEGHLQGGHWDRLICATNTCQASPDLASSAVNPYLHYREGRGWFFGFKQGLCVFL